MILSSNDWSTCIWRGSFDRNLPSPDLAILDSKRLASLLQQVIEQAAEKKPCVIIGRGAPYFLRDRADTFCVFLYASRELKFRRVLKRVGNEAEAIHLVDTHRRGSPEVRETPLWP